MSEAATSRPIGITVAFLVSLCAVIAHLALVDLPMVEAGNISPLGCALFWAPLLLGLLGFWLMMRWWAVALTAVAALCLVAFYALGHAASTKVVSTIVIIAVVIESLVSRERFR